MTATCTETCTDLIALVPGFLGFEKVGDFKYWQYVATELEQLLKSKSSAKVMTNVMVDDLDTIPAGSLKKRQEKLIKQLSGCVLEYPGLKRIYLIGHSTGGVDARLLLATERVNKKPWAEGEKELRRKIKLVVAIAAPYHGTWITEHPEIGWLAKSLSDIPVWSPVSLSKHGYWGMRFVASLGKVAYSLFFDKDVRRFLKNGFIKDQASALKIIESILRNRGLLRDLRPAVLAEINNRCVPDTDPAYTFRLRSVVTISGTQCDTDHEHSDCSGGRLFHWLSERVKRPRTLPDPRPEQTQRAMECIQLVLNRALTTLRGRPVSLICNPKTRARLLNEDASDAVVNTTRQLYAPDEGNELLAVVVADHLDVTGFYDHEERTTRGIIKSGSAFGSKEFHSLYSLIVDEILDTYNSALP